MDTQNDVKNYILIAAVAADDVNEVDKQLKEGANPNYSLKLIDPLLELALKNCSLKIIELLIQYGSNVTRDFVKQIFKPDWKDIYEEIIAVIVKYKHKDIEVIQSICVELIESDCESSKTLELLLDHGLPIDGYMDWFRGELFTPLQVATIYDREDFVSKLYYFID